MDNLEKKIQQILLDLYKIDPNFKQHEAKIAIIIKEVLLAKPDTKFDEKFAEDLRRRLMAKADLLKEKQNKTLFGSLKFAKRLNYALGAVAVLTLIIAGGLLSQDRKNKQAISNKTLEIFSGKTSVTKAPSHAFGDLALSSPQGSQPTGMGGAGAGIGAADANSAPKTALGLGGGGMPMLINYQYVYKGGEFSLDQPEMDVYRRVRTAVSGTGAASLLKQMDFGIIDMNTFSNLSLQNLNFAEDKDYGYMFYVSLEEGTISISENWKKWPSPENTCKDSACFEQNRVKFSDVPEDAALIAMANQFLKDHNISTASYGEPLVENSWKEEYLKATDKTNSYIPNFLTVIYPQIINGNEVYDEGGNPAGLTVSVDLYAKKASGVSELYAQNYESSAYEVETDAGQLTKLAEQGGRNGNFSNPGAGRTVQVELGTPHLGYVKSYQPQEQGGPAGQMLIPALIFPITKVSQDTPFYQKNVVVFLPKDFQQTENPVRIMPMQ
ncbi:MAG: hypothetical protein M1383_00770 [Patescibacteria group bacterium]|nr:hypothetical protein [Patescibacteria group bacterium]